MKILNGITLTGNAALNADSLTVGTTQIIATSGRVGIGTTNPTTTLQVAGTITATTFSGPLSGNATTATTLQTARTINATSFNGSANITIDQLYRIDDRAIAPGDITTGYMKFGFGSWNNNSTSPYADFLHFRSYADSSGGSDNLLMFAKNTIGIRLYQQAYGSTTNYSTYRDVAFTDSPAFTGQVVVAAGTSAAPAITTTGDTNTGIYFPAADTIAFGEGGTEVMRITSGGSLGIGVTNPATKLEVAGGISLSGTLAFNGSAGSSGQVLISQGSSAPAWGSLSGSYLSITGGTLTGSLVVQNGDLEVSGIITSSTIYALGGLKQSSTSFIQDSTCVAFGNETSALGQWSFVQGQLSEARGDFSTSLNLNTIAQGYAQTVVGKFNVAQGTSTSFVSTDNAFIVGNGVDDTSRSNAFSVAWNGGATFAGTISAAAPTNSNHVALKSNVDDAIAIAWLGL